MGPANGNEGLRFKMQTRQMALAERCGDGLPVHPGSAELFKRRLRAAANGNAGSLQNFNPRIKNRTFRRAQRRRRRNPVDAGAFKKVIAVPVPHGDHVQLGADVILSVEELGQLANGQTVAHRDGKVRHEAGFVRIEHRPFHDLSAQRIGTIQNKKRNLAFGRFFHAVGHGDRVGVETHASVLNIEDQRVDALQHFIGWTARIAVQAVNRKARRGIFRGRHVFVGAAGEPVLGAEQRDELQARCPS